CRQFTSVTARSLAHVDVPVAPEIHTLAVRRQRRALLYASRVDGIAHVLRLRPPGEPPGVRDVHVLTALGRLVPAPGRAIRAEHDLEATVLAFAHVRHDVVKFRAELFDYFAGAEASISAHAAHVDVLVAAASVARVEQKCAEPGLDQ